MDKRPTETALEETLPFTEKLGQPALNESTSVPLKRSLVTGQTGTEREIIIGSSTYNEIECTLPPRSYFFEISKNRP